MEKYVLLTGSDLGDRNANLRTALDLIGERIGKVLTTSDILETEPWGFDSDTRFLNQAILVETELGPETILQEILRIEIEIGRERTGTQWTSRLIDIDILCAENISHSTEQLTVPHQHLQNRYFALAPLCELVPDWKHPTTQKTYKQLLEELIELDRKQSIRSS